MMPFLGITLVLLVLLAGRLASLNRKEREFDSAFRDRENQAKMAIHGEKTLDDLPFIYVDLEKLIPNDIYRSKALEIQDELIAISKEPIVNLNQKTNTDLRLEYGVTNFDEVASYGENFAKLETILDAYCAVLIVEDKWQLAMTVAEFAVGCGTDVRSIYTSLIDCYRYLGKDRKIAIIREQVESSEILMKASILDYIDNYNPNEPDEEADITDETSAESSAESEDASIDLNAPIDLTEGQIQIKS